MSVLDAQRGAIVLAGDDGLELNGKPRALVLVPTGLVMMLVAGVPRGYLLKLVGIVGLVGTLFVVDVVFMPSVEEFAPASAQTQTPTTTGTTTEITLIKKVDFF